MRLVLLADTHIPRRARDLPAAGVGGGRRRGRRRPRGRLGLGGRSSTCWRSGPAGSSACYGNNDGPRLRARLPLVARVELDGLRLGVVHETGPATGRERRCDAEHPDLDVLVFGHSHIPWDTVTPRGMRLLNPGSPTDRRRQPFATFLTATVGRRAAWTT